MPLAMRGTWAIGPTQSRTLHGHQRMCGLDLAPLKGVVLDGLPAGDNELIGLPPKVRGGDARPLRAARRES